MTNFEALFENQKSTADIARELLGLELQFQSEKGPVGGLIVETEAYLGATDPASFAYRNKRTIVDAPLFGPSGTIFVYKAWGKNPKLRFYVDGNKYVSTLKRQQIDNQNNGWLNPDAPIQIELL